MRGIVVTPVMASDCEHLMAAKLKLQEVCLHLDIDDALLQTLVDEEFVYVTSGANKERMVSVDDAERLRMITLLMREMEVNLAGVEVILHLREQLEAMQRQFDDILGTLVAELRQRVGKVSRI